MNELINTPYFGIFLTLFSFAFGHYLFKKTKLVLFNPLLFSIIIIIIFLKFSHISYESYMVGGSIINILITPATIALAIKLEENFDYFRQYAHYILISILIGIITHSVMIFGLAKVFHFDIKLMASIYAKSITTAIAVDVTEELNGFIAITIISVILTGLTGAIISNFLFKKLNIQQPVAQGIALGSAAHAMGTSHAIQLGPVQGAMSSVALVITGIIVMLTTPLAQIMIQWLYS